MMTNTSTKVTFEKYFQLNDPILQKKRFYTFLGVIFV